MHTILTKWIEPYVLLETLKKYNALVKVYTFDGFTKNGVKKEFLSALKEQGTFGLYMKNVNLFYLFQGDVEVVELFGLSPEDYELTDESEKIFQMVDLGKAEAGFTKFYN